VLDRILQLYSLSLTRLELLVSLMQLGLEVVNIALDGGQLVPSVLQSGAGIIKEVSFEVTAAINPHQLIIQLLDTRLKVGILLKMLSVTLLNILDGAVLGLHLVGILLQVETLVGASRRDLLKHGAHVLGVACRECPTRMVDRKLGVANSGYALTQHRDAMAVPSRTGRWCSQNSMRAWWAALSSVSSRSLPLAMVNQAVLLGSEA
jgi:hypothetical protein